MCKFHLQPKLRLIWDVKCSSLNLLLIVWTPHWTWLQNLKKFLKYNTVPKYGSSISHEAQLKIWESYRVVVTVNCCFKCWFYDQSSMWLSFMRCMTRLVQTMVMLSPEEGVMWSLTMPYLDILQEKKSVCLRTWTLCLQNLLWTAQRAVTLKKFKFATKRGTQRPLAIIHCHESMGLGVGVTHREFPI